MSTSGHIRKKPDRNTWEVIVDIGPDPATGARRQRSRSYPTKRAANAGRAKWITELEDGTAVERTTMTIADLMHYWLDTYAEHRVRPITLASYRNTIAKHLIPRFGAWKVQALTPFRLQRAYADMIAEGVGPRSVELCHMRLRQALAMAVEQGLVARNVALSAHPPRVPSREMLTWTAAQCRQFWIRACESSYGPVWLVALETGMRRGELLGLRWRDVDLEARTISIRQSVVPVNGKTTIVASTKNDSSRRTIPMAARLVDPLREHHAHQAERRHRLGVVWKDHGLVFASDVGTPIGPRNLERDFERWGSRSGVPRIRVHDVRHTFASLALAAGVPAHVVAAILGHADIATTLGTYAHVMPGQDIRAVSAVDAVMFDVADASS